MKVVDKEDVIGKEIGAIKKKPSTLYRTGNRDQGKCLTAFPELDCAFPSQAPNHKLIGSILCEQRLPGCSAHTGIYNTILPGSGSQTLKALQLQSKWT